MKRKDVSGVSARFGRCPVGQPRRRLFREHDTMTDHLLTLLSTYYGATVADLRHELQYVRGVHKTLPEVQAALEAMQGVAELRDGEWWRVAETVKAERLLF